jgi:hypothetical protein
MSTKNNDPKRYTIEDVRQLFEHADERLEMDDDVALLTTLAKGLEAELSRSLDEHLDELSESDDSTFGTYCDRLEGLMALCAVVRERVEVAEACLRARGERFRFEPAAR